MNFKREENLKFLKEDPEFYKTSKFDVIIICLILFLSISCIAWANHRHLRQSQAAQTVLIYQNDKLLEELSLKKDSTEVFLNGKVQIEVKDRKIRVLHADCPAHICMNMGWIRYSGETIVCAPNKVIIEIKSTGSPLIDAVAN